MLQLDRGEVDHHVRCQVVGRVVHLVQHLFFDGLQIDRAAGTGHFGDDGGAVGFDLGDRKAEVPRLRHVFETGVGKIPAGDLRAAFQQMAYAHALTEFGRVHGVPAELKHHRRHEDGRVGHAPGHHDMRTGFERSDDGFGTQIGFG